mmetsp:Transcript_357/g.1051  ORF Transcript_357/g.1051 Transcript_357/m.1051 type:complete len:276 (-) Transcript_357:1095-1922(-)
MFELDAPAPFAFVVLGELPLLGRQGAVFHAKRRNGRLEVVEVFTAAVMYNDVLRETFLLGLLLQESDREVVVVVLLRCLLGVGGAVEAGAHDEEAGDGDGGVEEEGQNEVKAAVLQSPREQVVVVLRPDVQPAAHGGSDRFEHRGGRHGHAVDGAAHGGRRAVVDATEQRRVAAGHRKAVRDVVDDEENVRLKRREAQADNRRRQESEESREHDGTPEQLRGRHLARDEGEDEDLQEYRPDGRQRHDDADVPCVHGVAALLARRQQPQRKGLVVH